MSIEDEAIPGGLDRAYVDEVGPERALLVEGVLNARDLGGLHGELGTVRSRAVLRAACLSGLTERGASTLEELGLRTVIDLRTPPEREAEPDRVAGMPGLEDVHELRIEVLGTLHGLPAGYMPLYRHLVDHCGDGIVEVLEYLARPGTLPALVHCMVGKDRTGLTVALLLELLGVPREEIIADYVASNAGLGGEAHTTVYAEVMQQTLAWLDEEHGSPLGYLAAHGLTQQTVNALQAALLV